MNYIFLLLVTVTVVSASTDPTAVEAAQDIVSNCLLKFQISGCVKPRALSWVNKVAENNVVRITDDLYLIKKFDAESQERSDMENDVMEKFEDFIQSHNIVARTPAFLRPDGPFGMYVPRTFQPTEVSVPLAATARSSKIVKKVIFPFLLGLKFKTAVLVPLALTLIALKTWKAVTLALLSLVLTGAIAIFSKFVAPKVPAYEVVHVPQAIDHHHVDVVSSPLVHYGHPVYAGRALKAQELAYKAHVN